MNVSEYVVFRMEKWNRIYHEQYQDKSENKGYQNQPVRFFHEKYLSEKKSIDATRFFIFM